MEVCKSLHTASPNDSTKTVKSLWETMMGCFRVEYRDFTPYLGMKPSLRDLELPLVPVRINKATNVEYWDNHGTNFKEKSSNFDPSHVKIKIKDAWEVEHQVIAHEMFDNYFAVMGIGIIKQTQPMYCNRSRNT